VELRAEWEDLLDDSKQRVYFLRHDWNRLWWTYHAPRGSRLHVITCRDENDRLVGVAPLYWRQRRVFGIRCVRELLFLGMGIELKTSEYLDVVAREGYEKAVGTAVAQHLKAASDWDRVSLSQVPATSTALPQFVRALKDVGEQATMARCDRAPYIDTSGSWDGFKRSLGRSMRRNVEYYARRLFKKYDCEFARVESLEQLDSALDALVRLHQARWLSKGEPGSFSNTSFAPFLRQVMSQSQIDGRLRFWTIKINGSIEAALVGFLDNGVVHYFQKGFNPQYAKDDLGTAMLALAVRACFEDDKVNAFDFMGGGAPYKDLWARASQQTMSCEVHRINIRTRLLTLRDRVALAIKTVGRVLTPPRLRTARREWLRNSRMRSWLKSTTQILLIAAHHIVTLEPALVPLRGLL
jgi:CelD/BcsL family acetyltransferase involved in cellulose biosynthesis